MEGRLSWDLLKLRTRMPVVCSVGTGEWAGEGGSRLVGKTLGFFLLFVVALGLSCLLLCNLPAEPFPKVLGSGL